MREFKISETGLKQFMTEKYPMKQIVDDRGDNYLIRSNSGKGPIQMLPKNDIEAYCVFNNLQTTQDDKALVDGKNAANRFARDTVYHQALDDLTPEGKQEFLENIETMTPLQAAEHQQRLRDNYAGEKYGDHQHARHVAPHERERERVEQAGNIAENVNDRKGSWKPKDQS